MNTHTETEFVCDCKKRMRSACNGAVFFKEYEGKRYCVLHYPDKDKLKAFCVALKKKLEAQEFDFRGVWFPEAINFREFQFSAKACFDHATFSADALFDHATFSADALFDHATFSADAKFFNATFTANTEFFNTKFSADASFSNATFSAGASFDEAKFSADASFFNTTFSAKALFDRAKFSANASFDETKFSADASFSNTTFSAKALFDRAKFSANANFSNATFSAGASFGAAIFSAKAYFDNAKFSADANFFYTEFSAMTSFDHAKFSADVDFGCATFSTIADFGEATFKDYVRFASRRGEREFGKHSLLTLHFAHIEKPDRFSFHTLDLRPHWFVGVDPRRFEFIDVEWRYKLREDLESLRKASVSAPHRLLAITYRQLADNAEANHRYREASRFRYNAFEAQRIERFWGFVPWRLNWWYLLASGYGESVLHALIVFVVLITLFAFGYTRVGFEQANKTTVTSAEQMLAVLPMSPPDTKGNPLRWKDAAIYAAYVSILQKPDPKPLTRWAKILVWLETVFGPAQAALLALAVRRRFNAVM